MITQIYKKIITYNSISELNFHFLLIRLWRKKSAEIALWKKTNFATLFLDYFNKIIHIFAMSKRHDSNPKNLGDLAKVERENITCWNRI